MFNWKNPASWLVLIVDDERDNLDLVVIYLTVMGAQIKSAMNGTEALEILKNFKPNLILLDLSMPMISGWDMLEILHANPDTQNVCTIALTAHAMPSDREQAQAAGFNGYLSKPINLPTLLTDLELSIFSPEHTKEKPHGNS